MAKEGKSPKLRRVGKKPSKGIAHRHNPKPKRTLENTGLLDDLTHKVWRREHSAATSEDNLAKIRQYLCDELVGPEVSAIFRKENWPTATRLLVCDYIKSLTLGDGTRPTELDTVSAERVQAVFVKHCSQRIVGDDTLPAQRQDWYQPMLQAYRKARSKQQKAKRPTPQDIPRKRALQPTG